MKLVIAASTRYLHMFRIVVGGGNDGKLKLSTKSQHYASNFTVTIDGLNKVVSGDYELLTTKRS